MHRLLSALCATSLFALGQVPVPKVTPLPVTADSRPFDTAARNLEPLDLAKLGYVEEEFLVSGTANIYSWEADGSIASKAGGPYVDRILIRRPADPSRFSGTAIVELPNTARRWDWAILWGYSHNYFIEQGHAWVQVTMAQSIDSLKKFDEKRYGTLSFANPAGSPCQNPAEEGLRWDVISQVAAALKAGPLGFRAQRVFMTTQNPDITTYINAFHDRTKVFDGYVPRNPAAPARINSCAPAIPQNDPRNTMKEIDAPVISVVAQGEAMASLRGRKPDSAKYRHYEVAVASHIDTHAYAGFPSFEDQTKVGSVQGTPQWMFTARCEPEIVFQDLPLLGYVFNAAFENLHRWAKDGVAPPNAPRLVTENNQIVVDEFGIARGGIRSPYSDAPTARYTHSTRGGGVCREMGTTTPLPWSRLEAMYGSHKNYVQKASAAIDKMLAERFVTESDAKRLRAELLQ